MLGARCASDPALLPDRRTSGFVHTPCSGSKQKGAQGPFWFGIGGEGGIRTHVPGLTDHPISSRRRYDHFGTSPEPVILTDMAQPGTVGTRAGGVAPGHWLRLLPIALLGLSLVACSGWRAGEVMGELRDRGVLRVGTLNSPTTYFEGADGPAGYEYRLALAFAERLDLELEMITAPDRASLRRLLKDKKIDLAAAQLTWHRGWRGVGVATQDYSESPLLWVYRRGTARPQSETDLQDKRIVILADSTAAAELETRSAIERAALDWTVLPRQLGRDPLELVSTGAADATLVDGREFAHRWPLYPQLVVAFALPERRKMQWIIRRDGKDLLAAANEFLAEDALEYAPPSIPDTEPTPTATLNHFDSRPFSLDIEPRLPSLRPLFEMAANETGLDWQLLAALGYQESRWQADARSPNGAEGLMMLMPRTAKMLGVANSFGVEENILAGSRYLADLHAKLPARIAEPDRTWMAIASYNMGYGHLEDARVLTVRQGGNPDAWADVRERLTLLSEEFWYLQVRHGYARGWETKLMLDRIQQFLQIIRELTPTPAATAANQPAVASTRMRAERQVPAE